MVQKQPPEVFYKKVVLKKIPQNSQENTRVRISFLIKVQASSVFRCFPVNFMKFLRKAFLQNTPGQLLLMVCNFAMAESHTSII